MSNVFVAKNSRGVVYDHISVQSKQLVKSPEIQNFIIKNFKDLISGNAKDVYDIEFLQHGNFTGIQHCKLYKPHITKDGYFVGIIVDYYDFEYRMAKSIAIPTFYVVMYTKRENSFILYVRTFLMMVKR